MCLYYMNFWSIEERLPLDDQVNTDGISDIQTMLVMDIYLLDKDLLGNMQEHVLKLKL